MLPSIFLFLGAVANFVFIYRAFKFYNTYNIKFDYYKGWREIKKSERSYLIREYKVLLVWLHLSYCFILGLIVSAIVG